MEIKIPFYNVLNMFLTGLSFLGVLVIVFPKFILNVFNNEVIKSLDFRIEVIVIVCVFSIAYEIGMIINRVGSLIENLLKWWKWIKFNDNYVLFNEKKKEYPIMSTLSREYALSRTRIALFLILLILSSVAREWFIAIACVIVTIIYYLSCKKHASKIVELMEGEKLSR